MLEQLKDYLESNKDKVIYLSLYPEQGDRMIREEAINRCYVTIAGQEKEFKNISEKDFDILVDLYDWSEIKKNKQL